MRELDYCFSKTFNSVSGAAWLPVKLSNSSVIIFDTNVILIYLSDY